MPKMNMIRLFSLAILIAAVMTDVSAQTDTTGAIQGGVYYYEGSALKPVINAEVTIKNQETGLQRITRTNMDGNYRVDMLPPGFYSISAMSQGYEQLPQSTAKDFSVYLQWNNLVKPPPILLSKIGAPAPPVATSSSTPSGQEVEQLINTSNGARGGNFNTRQLTILPLPGIRSFEMLAFLLPGVAPAPLPAGTNVGPGIGAGIGTAGQFSVNGQRARSNNFTIDGSDNNDEDVGVRRQGFVSLVPQSVESVQEFQMSTHLWETNVGRNLGSQVNAVSRSGTNQIHGTVYGFFNHDALNARDFFDYKADKAQSYPLEAFSPFSINGRTDCPQGTTRVSGGCSTTATFVNGVNGAQTPIVLPNPSQGENPYRRVQGGMTIGGPISKKFFGPLAPNDPARTFFFGSVERQHVKADQETHFSVPTVAQRGFLGSGASGFRLPGLERVQINQPGQFTLPIIRPTFTAGDAVFSLFPFPNNPIGPYDGNTFTQVLPASADGTIASFKLDHNFKLFGSDKESTLTARYNFTNDERQVPAVGGAIFSGVVALIGTQNLSLFLSSQLTTTVTNQLRGSYGRTRLRFQPLRAVEQPSAQELSDQLERLRNPSLLPSSFTINDPRNAAFLLNQRRLLNISCADFPGLPTDQGRVGCLTPGSNLPPLSRDRFGFFSFGGSFVSTEPNLGPIGQLIVAPYSPVGLDPYLFPQGRVNNTYQIADDLSLFRGRHTLRLGGDVRRSQLNSFLDRNFRPQVIFSGTTDISGDVTLPANSLLPVEARRLSQFGPTPGFFSGTDLAALGVFTGIFQTMSLQTPDSSIGLRFWQFNTFFNDTWRFKPGLTLNFGLRYEYNTVPREVDERIERTFDLNGILPPVDPTINFGNNALRQTAIAATFRDLNRVLAGRDQIYQSDRNNFGPQLSFAWDPWAGSQKQVGRTVIRGGAGIYYDVTLGSIVSQSRNVFPTFLPLNVDQAFYSSVIPALFQGFPNGYTVIPNGTLVGIGIGNNGGSDAAFTSAGCRLLGQQSGQNVYGCDFIRSGTLNTIGIPSGGQQLFLAGILNPAGVNRPPSGAGLAFTLPDQGLRSPQAFHFNLQIERELFSDYLVNLAYVGSRGLELTRFRTPNGGLLSPTSPLDPLQLSRAAGGAALLPAISRPPLSTIANPTRPNYPALGAFTIFDSSASSRYHAFQTSLSKRFSAGTQFTAAYTWSHAIDDVSDVFDMAGAFVLPQDDRNLRLERASANFDIRHRFTFSALTGLPFLDRFSRVGGARGAVLGGWQLALITVLQTGQPFTVNTSFDVNQDGNLTDRPNDASGLQELDSRQQRLQLTAARPTDLLAPVGQNGSVGRNTFRASGIANTDLAFIKNFRLHEEQSLVLRVEAFNVFNRTQFGMPVRILEAPSFGQSVNTILPSRQIQLALKYVF